MAKATYYQDERPYAASQGRLWPPLIRCLFLGMLLSCGHQSYLREGKKAFISLLSLFTRCDITYRHISTGKRNGAWLIMATLRYLLSSPGKEAPGAEDDYAACSSNACSSSSFLLPRGFLKIPPQMLCSQRVKATTCLALIAHLNFSRRLHVFTIDLQYRVANRLAAERLQCRLRYLRDPRAPLPLRLRRVRREVRRYPHLLVGLGGTGKPPGLGACAATARAVGKREITDDYFDFLATCPDW